jgi:site-specific recombinase XerD
MNISEALEKLTDAIRLRHLAASTEECYRGWLQSYMQWLASRKIKGTSERKVEAFLTMQARRGVAASTQNQAFNALLFFYKCVLGTPLEAIDAARVRRPERVRTALSVEETRALLGAVEDVGGYPTRLVARLLYGAGLRVTEPLELRLKDVYLGVRQLTIRGAKGGKDRIVSLPECMVAEVEAQMRVARAVWRGDAAAGLPVSLPGLLGRKSQRLGLTEAWAWIFPAHEPIAHPRTGERVRWRMHEVNVQRAVRAAAAKVGLGGKATPHVLSLETEMDFNRRAQRSQRMKNLEGKRQMIHGHSAGD